MFTRLDFTFTQNIVAQMIPEMILMSFNEYEIVLSTMLMDFIYIVLRAFTQHTSLDSVRSLVVD